LDFTEFLTGVDKAWKPSDSDKCKFLDGNKISKPSRERLQLT
jgi:hypothetical protein